MAEEYTLQKCSVPERGPALLMHFVNIHSKLGPILCNHICIRYYQPILIVNDQFAL